MKRKRLSNFAFGFGLLAVIFAVWDVCAFFKAALYNPYDGYIPLHTNVLELVRNMSESVVQVSGTLFALAVIIELIDQIRWNALQQHSRHSLGDQ
jgi:hypothetical protein